MSKYVYPMVNTHKIVKEIYLQGQIPPNMWLLVIPKESGNKVSARCSHSLLTLCLESRGCNNLGIVSLGSNCSPMAWNSLSPNSSLNFCT